MTEAATSALHPLQAGQVLDARFRIVRELGRGAMGAVYEVDHVLTGHRRALKLLDATSADSVHRVVREASAAARIRSAHVVETIDAGLLPDGQAYILMELLEGESWAAFMKRSGPLAIAQACRLGAQACVALAAAHRVGIVHRDVKPANLFVVGDAAAPVVKIIDFGISRFDPVLTDATELTAEGVILGTPYYMAPEQLRGERDLDGRADVYSLAVVLYLAIAGKHPYRGTSVAELAVQVLRGEQEPILRLRPDVGEELAALLHGAMSTDPARRPDADTFGRRLLAHAGLGEARMPARASLARVSARRVTRRWSLVVAAVAVVVVGSGVALVRRAAVAERAGFGLVAVTALHAVDPVASSRPPPAHARDGAEPVAAPTPPPRPPAADLAASTRPGSPPAPPRSPDALDRRNPYAGGAR